VSGNLEIFDVQKMYVIDWDRETCL